MKIIAQHDTMYKQQEEVRRNSHTSAYSDSLKSTESSKITHWYSGSKICKHWVYISHCSFPKWYTLHLGSEEKRGKIFSLFFVMLGLESRSSFTLGKYFVTEVQPGQGRKFWGFSIYILNREFFFFS